MEALYEYNQNVIDFTSDMRMFNISFKITLLGNGILFVLFVIIFKDIVSYTQLILIEIPSSIPIILLYIYVKKFKITFDYKTNCLLARDLFKSKIIRFQEIIAIESIKLRSTYIKLTLERSSEKIDMDFYSNSDFQRIGFLIQNIIQINKQEKS